MGQLVTRDAPVLFAASITLVIVLAMVSPITNPMVPTSK